MSEDQRLAMDRPLRSGFEPNIRVIRAEENGKGLVAYDVFAPIAVGTMGRQLPEDILSRSLSFVMQEKPASAIIARTIDQEEADRLSARLLALRMRYLIGDMNVAALGDKTLQLATRPIKIDGREVLLNDRSIDKGRALLVSAVLLGDPNDVLELLAQSELDTEDALRETFEGQAFFALMAVIELDKREGSGGFDPAKICLSDVAAQLNTDLSMQGNARRDSIKTRRVGDALRALGFRFVSGHGNRSFFDPATFDIALATNTRKFGLRPMVNNRSSSNHGLTNEPASILG
jgi:hypothetical protein